MKIDFPRTDAVVRTLDNGLEIVVKEDYSAPVVAVQVWIRTGSCFEGELTGSGVSHLVEHMVFKGSAERGAADLSQAVQAVGGYLNAYTSFDRTVYYVDVPVEGTGTALDVLAHLTLRAALDEKEFEKEKDVIRREIDMGDDDPDIRNSHLLFETVFRFHPMGQPIIGHRPLFDRLTREQTASYYQRHYVPNNMFVVVVGPLDADQAEEMVATRFGNAQRAPAPVPGVPEEPGQLGLREAHLEFPTDLSKLNLAWRVPGLTHPEIPALEVLSEILGQGRSSRLYRRIRQELGLAHTIGSSCYAPPTGGVFTIQSDLDFADRAAVREAALEMVSAIQDRGVSEGEVGKARKMVLGEQLESLTTMRGLAGDLGSNWQVARNLDFTRDMIESIERVTPADVQGVARRYLVERALTVTSLNPQGSLTPVRRTTHRADREEVERTVLDNGITLLVHADPRVPLITLHATLRGGSLAESAQRAGLMRLMTRSLLKGTARRSADEISGLIEESGGAISSESGGSSWSITVDALKPDLEMGVDLLADVLLRPSFPVAEVAREKEVQLAAIRADADRLTSVAFRHLRETIFGPHPFALERNGTPDSLARIDADALREAHRGAAVTENLVVAIYGDVDPAQARRAVEEKFAGMAAGPRLISPPQAGFAPDLDTVQRDVIRPKKQAVLAVGYPTVDLIHPDRVALDLLDEACSDMGSRLFLRIREESGLAYYTGAFQILGMAPGAFVFYLGTSPDQLDHAQNELLEEIDSLARHGLSEPELERVKQSWLGKHLIHHQGPDNLARSAALDELYGVGFDYHHQLAARVREIGIDEVNRVARERFAGPSRRAIVRVRPEAGSRSGGAGGR